AVACGWLASNSHGPVGLWEVQHLGAVYPKLTALVVLPVALLIWGVPIVALSVQRILRLQADGRGELQAEVQRRPHAPLELGPLATFLRRHAGLVSAGFAVLAIVSVAGLRHFLKDPFEYDFRKLNAKLATTEEAKQFNKNLDRVFGRWPSPTILLADSV